MVVAKLYISSHKKLELYSPPYKGLFYGRATATYKGIFLYNYDVQIRANNPTSIYVLLNMYLGDLIYCKC